MMRIEFRHAWQAAGHDEPEYYHTTARFDLRIGEVKLTENEDIWSQTIRDDVLVSLYPMAHWLAWSWWRLNFEPLPHTLKPSTDWRMAHELGAANRGYVWPQIAFASDGESIQVWAAAPSRQEPNQSVRYLNGLDLPASLALDEFQGTTSALIESVISRLQAVGQEGTDLAELWRAVQEERGDPGTAKRRRIEAEMGFDAEECPEEIMREAFALETRMGGTTLDELAPVYGKSPSGASLKQIEQLADGDGLTGAPDPTFFARLPRPAHRQAPWQRAVEDARSLRASLSNLYDPMATRQVCELLGLKESDIDNWLPQSKQDAAIAVPIKGNEFKFIPRKSNRQGKRFQLSRFLADYLLRTRAAEGGWLASTELGTSRQKYQRAFAAEFLCPIDALRAYLAGDFSEPAIEDAADEFEVSPVAVKSLLANNDLIPRPTSAYPYRISY